MESGCFAYLYVKHKPVESYNAHQKSAELLTLTRITI